MIRIWILIGKSCWIKNLVPTWSIFPVMLLIIANHNPFSQMRYFRRRRNMLKDCVCIRFQVSAYLIYLTLNGASMCLYLLTTFKISSVSVLIDGARGLVILCPLRGYFSISETNSLLSHFVNIFNFLTSLNWKLSYQFNNFVQFVHPQNISYGLYGSTCFQIYFSAMRPRTTRHAAKAT